MAISTAGEAAIAADIALALYQQPGGVPVPSADALAQSYGVAPGTAEAALVLLRDAGLPDGGPAGRPEVTARPVLTVLAAAAISGRLADQDPDHEPGFVRAQERFLREACRSGASARLERSGLVREALQMLASGCILAGPTARKFRWMTWPGLTPDERRILAFEDRAWKTPGEKAEQILKVLELDETRYYQQLAGLIDRKEALREYPVVVNRARARLERRWHRRFPAPGGQP